MKTEITLYQGTILSGPKSNENEVRKLVEEIEEEMKKAYTGAEGMGSESRAMDERDDMVYEYEEELENLGWKIE